MSLSAFVCHLIHLSLSRVPVIHAMLGTERS
jgi:hypothetical protein